MNVLYVIIIISLCFLVIAYFQEHTVEHFVDRSKLIIDPYQSYTLDEETSLRPQVYLDFLEGINDQYLSQTPSSTLFRGAALSKPLEDKILRDAYSKLNSSQAHKDSCVSKAISICEMTDPIMSLSQTRYPPKWLIKSLKDQSPPSSTNLSCFESTYACCRSVM